jgi:hypothetical protein
MSVRNKLSEIINCHPDDLSSYLKSTYQLCVKESNTINIPTDDINKLEEGEIQEKVSTGHPPDQLVLIRYYRDKVDLTDPLVKFCRGLIYDRLCRRVVCESFQAREDYQTTISERGLDDAIVTEIIDGTMVNLYYYQGTWRLSTKGCLDADTAYWSGSLSFGNMFREIWEPDPTVLSEQCCYSFVVVHPENRIVTPVNESRLVLVKVTDLLNDVSCMPYAASRRAMDKSELVPDCGNFQLPLLKTFDSVTNLEDSLSKRSYECPGYMITYPDGCRIRLDNPKYRKVANLRGNKSDRYHNMLDLLKQTDTTASLVDEYLSYYPDETVIWEDIEILTRRCLASIMFYYNRVMKQHQYTVFPTHLRRTIHELHKLYIQKKTEESDTPFRITHRVVKGYFHSLPTTQQNYLLKSHELWLIDQDAEPDQ